MSCDGIVLLYVSQTASNDLCGPCQVRQQGLHMLELTCHDIVPVVVSSLVLSSIRQEARRNRYAAVSVYSFP